jgi:hypothetical protein
MRTALTSTTKISDVESNEIADIHAQIDQLIVQFTAIVEKIQHIETTVAAIREDARQDMVNMQDARANARNT